MEKGPVTRPFIAFREKILVNKDGTPTIAEVANTELPIKRAISDNKGRHEMKTCSKPSFPPKSMSLSQKTLTDLAMADGRDEDKGW